MGFPPSIETFVLMHDPCAWTFSKKKLRGPYLDLCTVVLYKLMKMN